MAHKRILLEEIVSSVDDALAAAKGGADRFELCSALVLGGLTPSLATLQGIKARTSVPVMFMLRPRQGGMAYTEAEFQTMLEDASLALERGSDGLVFGFLTEEGRVDTLRCRRLLDQTERLGRGKNIQTVFHRAFDIVADPSRALEELIDLGVDRILTSGRAPTASQGLEEIQRSRDQAKDRIQILPGGGIDEEDVGAVVKATGVGQVHVYLPGRHQDKSALMNPAIHFGSDLDEAWYPVIDVNRVQRVRHLLDRI